MDRQSHSPHPHTFKRARERPEVARSKEHATDAPNALEEALDAKSLSGVGGPQTAVASATGATPELLHEGVAPPVGSYRCPSARCSFSPLRSTTWIGRCSASSPHRCRKNPIGRR